MPVKKNSKVVIEYEGKLEDGTIFDSSYHDGHSHPLEFVAGSNMVIKGFDEAIIGMETGEEKEFSIESKDAYGDYNPLLKKDIPRNILPKNQTPQKGMMIVLGTEDGKQFPAMITDVDNSSITVDLNHPLAGKKLFFKIKVVDVK